MDLGNLSAAIFSPVKMVYIAYAILTGYKILPAPGWGGWGFLLASVVFVVFEVFHNDYLRKRLNSTADKQGALHL